MRTKHNSKKKKPGPNGNLNKKQSELLQIYCGMQENDQSKWDAYNLAGYKGSKSKCMKLFSQPKIKRAIKKMRDTHFRIPSNEEMLNKNGTRFGKSQLLLSEQLTQKIESYLRKGLSYSQVSNLTSIHVTTIFEWLRKGKECIKAGEFSDPYAYFAYRVKAARDLGEIYLLDIVRKHARGGDTHKKKTTSQKVKDLFINGIKVEGGTEKTEVDKKIEHIYRSDWKAAAWLLEKTRPEKYGSSSPFGQGVGGTGFDNGDIDPREEAEDTATILRSLLMTKPDINADTEENTQDE